MQSTQMIGGVKTPVVSMLGVAGAVFDFPSDGDFVIVGDYVYQWDVVEDLGDYERWGWALYGPVCDADVLDVPTDTPRCEALPIFDK